MIDLRPDHLAVVERILQAELPEAAVYAFGSRARWTAEDGSDLDLMLAGSERLPFRRLTRLQQAFEVSYLPFSVDLVDMWAIDDEFRALIDQEKVLLKPACSRCRTTEEERWQVRPLAECADFLSGTTPTRARPEFWSGEVPWVRAEDMKQFRLWDSQDHVTDEAIENGARLVPALTTLIQVRGMTCRHDVPIGITRTSMSFHQDILALRSRPDVDPEYLAYSLLGSKAALQLLIDATWLGTFQINRGALESFPIPLPPLVEQRAIAGSLAAFDDKIELNQRMNEAVEAIVQELGKSRPSSPGVAKTAQYTRNSGTLSELRDALLPKLLSGELRLTGSFVGGS